MEYLYYFQMEYLYLSEENAFSSETCVQASRFYEIIALCLQMVDLCLSSDTW